MVAGHLGLSLRRETTEKQQFQDVLMGVSQKRVSSPKLIGKMRKLNDWVSLLENFSEPLILRIALRISR